MRLHLTLLCTLLGTLAQAPAHAGYRFGGSAWGHHHNHFRHAVPVGYAGYGQPRVGWSITFGSAPLFYNHGPWFRPYAYGPRYTVVAPPAVIVPVLPAGCGRTTWVGGTLDCQQGVRYPLPSRHRGDTAAEAWADGDAPVAAQAAKPVPPAPVFQARNGQTPTDTEGDRQACNRLAATQQAALLDAGEFQRTVAACMDERGYTVR